MDYEKFSQILHQLQSQVPTRDSNEESQRQTVLRTLRKLTHIAETPSERIARMCYPDIYLFTIVRILVDLKIFEFISQANTSVNVDQIAERTTADPVLLSRMLKFVCSQDIVEETGPEEYVANGITDKLATPEGQGVVIDMFHMYQLGSQLPCFLEERGYRNPANKDDSAFKYAFDTNDHYFQWISRPGRELQAQAFHNHMRFKTLGMKWFEMASIIRTVFGESQVSAEDVLMVDVGGGSGHDLVGFRDKHINFTGRLLLQDLPEAIQAANATGELARRSIETDEHDFFTRQPIYGARVYYLKMVLHDWPDEQCKLILEKLKPALLAGHSRILLNEIIIPEIGAGWFETSVDMIMMCAHSAQERRERDWKHLIDSVGGLKISNMWDVDGAVEKIIEIVLA